MLASTSAWAAETLKVFSDKGSFFVPSDKANPLTVGTELTMATDAAGTKKAGSAIVMEVTGALARITLDEAATKAKAKFALRPASASAEAAAAPSPAPAPAAPAPSSPKPSGKVPTLKGKLTNGIRVGIENQSDEKWTECELRYDDGRYFKLGELGPRSEDTVLFAFFKRPPGPPEPLYDHVQVTCDEGSAKFLFADPHSGKELKGYAENSGGGRVIVHNTSDRDWHRCNIVKPDGTHYLMDRLKAKDQDSIASGRFIKEKEPDGPKATRLDLRCAQGELTVKLD